MNNVFFEKYLLCDAVRERIKKCHEFLEKNDLKNMQNQSNIFICDGAFVNIFNTPVEELEKRFWEAHKKYIDIHYIIEGGEIIHLNDVSNMVAGEYDEEKDFVILDGPVRDIIKIEEGELCLCMPSDAHKPSIAIDENKIIRKAVFKVAVE